MGRFAWILLAVSACFSKPGEPRLNDDASVDGVSGAYNYVFVLSTPQRLDLVGSFAALDGTCQTAANNSGIPGNYVAWISQGSRHAVDLLQNARGWVRPGDHAPVVDTVSDLVNMSFFYPPRLDETGADVVGSSPPTVATGTKQDGSLGADCSSGMIEYGVPDADDLRWTSIANNLACNTTVHIYCFGTDHQTALSPIVDKTPRIAFLSSGDFIPGGGIAAADAICQAEATAAVLPGSYLAVLASSTTSAASRFTLTTPWHRVDGVRVTTDFTTWDAPLDITASGARRHPMYAAYSGAATPLAAGTIAGTCNDWALTSSSQGLVGDPGRSWSLRAFGSTPAPCSMPRGLYCFQQ